LLAVEDTKASIESLRAKRIQFVGEIAEGVGAHERSIRKSKF
jgi:hypothetical protein